MDSHTYRKEYKNIYFVSGAQGRIIKEHLPKIYIGQPDGTYRLNSKALDMISDDNEEVIANHMVRKKTWGDGSKKFLRTIFEYSKLIKDTSLKIILNRFSMIL